MDSSAFIQRTIGGARLFSFSGTLVRPSLESIAIHPGVDQHHLSSRGALIGGHRLDYMEACSDRAQ